MTQNLFMQLILGVFRRDCYYARSIENLLDHLDLLGPTIDYQPGLDIIKVISRVLVTAHVILGYA